MYYKKDSMAIPSGICMLYIKNFLFQALNTVCILGTKDYKWLQQLKASNFYLWDDKIVHQYIFMYS